MIHQFYAKYNFKKQTAKKYPIFISIFTGTNRHDRRVSAQSAGKKNTKGFPIGYNARSWGRYVSGLN